MKRPASRSTSRDPRKADTVRATRSQSPSSAKLHHKNHCDNDNVSGNSGENRVSWAETVSQHNRNEKTNAPQKDEHDSLSVSESTLLRQELFRIKQALEQVTRENAKLKQEIHNLKRENATSPPEAHEKNQECQQPAYTRRQTAPDAVGQSKTKEEFTEMEVAIESTNPNPPPPKKIRNKSKESHSAHSLEALEARVEENLKHALETFGTSLGEKLSNELSRKFEAMASNVTQTLNTQIDGLSGRVAALEGVVANISLPAQSSASIGPIKTHKPYARPSSVESP